MPDVRAEELRRLQAAVVACRHCPRLVAYREQTARNKVRRYREATYWGKPLPGFGDPAAALLIVGLAPAAHGGNRTGRMFTGDRSGEFLFRALYAAGFANQPDCSQRDDGLRLLNCYITAAVRCAPPANKPTSDELDACRSFLVREILLLDRVRVVVALGRIGFDAVLAAWAESGRRLPAKRPRFSHAAEVELPGGVRLLASYHPSQRNTQTGLLTASMFSRIFRRASRLISRAERQLGPVLSRPGGASRQPRRACHRRSRLL
jgi:uracil-DNA glycosylase family 4